MEYINLDDWGRPVYRCIETGELWKDINLGKHEPALYSCGNEMDGEPGWPIKNELTVVFKTKYEESPRRHDYMMLSRMQGQCDYYLGWGNRNEKHLCYENEKLHIEEMKKLWNSFPEGQKPEWLTYENIVNYEKLMVEA